MKARKIFSGLSALAMMAFAVGCSDDIHPDINQGGNTGADDGPGVYMTVNIAMPSAKGTRSQTTDGGGSTDGTEIGQDSENKVEEVLIVLAEEDTDTKGKKVQKFITSTKVTSTELVKVGTEDVYKTSSQFKKSAMLSYYNQLAQEGKLKDGVNPEVNVFVFCNPTAELLTYINTVQPKSTEWTEKTGTYIEKSEDNVIWSAGKFLMSNVSIATRQLPKTASDWNNYSTENTPFDLSGMNAAGRENQVDNYTGKGNVKVERTCARFDFRDGSLDGTEKDADKTKFNGVGNCTYNVVMDGNSDEVNKPCLVQIKLGKMALVNMNKNYFFLRHVSDDGTEKDMKLCGVERPWVFNPDGTINESSNAGNFVVDAVSGWKNTDNPNGAFDVNLNYPYFKQDNGGNWVVDNTDVSSDRWGTSLITEVLKEDKPNDKGGKYKIWRYGTETTVPGSSNQVNGISTGIIFKGKMIATEYATKSSDFWRNKLGTAINDSQNREGRSPYTDPILYSFGGHIYVTFEHMRRAALAASLTISWDNESNKWTYSVRRSNSLYRAVFGDGGFGTVEFNYTMTSGDNLNDQIMNEPTKEGNIGTITDERPVDENSAWYNWSKWNEKSKPAPTDPTNGDLYGKMKKAVVDGAKITIYQSSYDDKLGGWGYYCYYPYWNRHNDNGNNNFMAPMEFSVVRNNVYKLAVTKISRLGHPRISENDPDRPTPGTPNESDDIYLTVQCEVLPWVVRINNIEF